MKTLYVIVVYLLNSTTGDLEHELRSSTPLTLEQCNQALIDRGPVPAKDGLAQMAVCQKLKGDVKL
jgi:hypothetical protein